MRRYPVLFLMLLSLVLAGCGTVPTTETTIPVETTIPPQSVLPTEAPVETTVPPMTTLPPETTMPTTEPAATESQTVPYLQNIGRPDQSVFDGPGYDYGFVGTIHEKGTYTIVEEQWDYEGNLWGRLKSGMGWVDLTQIRSPEYAESLISANYADEYLLLHSACHYFPCGETEYFSSIAFRAYGTLRDVEIFAYELTNDGFHPGEVLYTLDQWTEDVALVAELTFPGDMSTYGIRFVDEDGVTHVFDIFISGRNGQVLLSKSS